MNKDTSTINIPHELIMSKDIKCNTFYLYVYLKTKTVNGVVNMYSSKMLKELGWINKTMKTHLQILKDYGYVDHDYDRFPAHKPMKINIIDIIPFESVNRDVINRIVEITKGTNITAQAIRLYYIYEKNYNYDWGFSCPSFREISISPNTINKINKLLQKNKLLRVIKGDWYYNENVGRKIRERNKYIPLQKNR